MVKAAVGWSRELVMARLEEMALVIRALPDREKGWMNSLNSFWPAIRRSSAENYGWTEARVRPPIPSPAAIDRGYQAYEWLNWIDEDVRPLVTARAFGFSYRRIGAMAGMSRCTSKRRIDTALSKVATRLNHELDRASKGRRAA